MPTVTRYRAGVPNWVDVTADDVDASVSFYSSLFGWEASDQGEQAGHYHMFTLGGRSVAGLGPRQNPDVPAAWTTYLAVDDLDVALGRAVDAGGSLVMPRLDIFTSGSMGVVIDPTGAPVSFWQAGDHIGCERVNEPNTLVWNELTTRDPERAEAFYSEVVGHRFTALDQNEPDGYRTISVGDRVVAGLLPMQGDDWGDLPSHWMPYFAVEDADAMATRAQELGGSIMVDPTDLPVGRFAVLGDPAGAVFSVMRMSGSVDDLPDGVA